MANINDLIIGISQALEKEFPNINIYKEEAKEDFKRPYFFIKVLSSRQKKEFNTRYKRNVSFDISYFSDKEDINWDCLNIADKLYEIFEYVAVDKNLYRATNMTHEITEGALHFFLQFSYRIVKQVEEEPKMQTLHGEVLTKND